ncbi:hypothetical protein CAPTEDRAFT_115578 [Capitella teleta]|uniref:G-protein coupled receptors family 1 profile domain-containing protein n=1 Tax=Capitella teleta TaxID=283909 RepID=R7UW22_CAPTE|nr:hypothetical protein CAPTEDRAFT_115578 [Capitella teleta]|eukprot:ELU10828.1 hypothetical protein CAPTEDRAFT_115578 [Capitella teleta]
MFNGNQDSGRKFYAYITPFIIVIGLCGNLISLRVFMARTLRKLSASVYLAAISLSDSFVLIFYVLFPWLSKGLPVVSDGYRVRIMDTARVCESLLFFTYLCRFVSVWLIVTFTVERYIAACRPLQRRVICTKAFGRKAIALTCLIGCLFSLYKPLVSGVFTREELVGPNTSTTLGNSATEGTCMANPEYKRINFIMDTMYGLTTTAIPFIVISIFNLLIVRTLIRRDATIKKLKIMFKDSRIRWEFTIMLLVVSSCYVCLNLPYFVLWCQQFLFTHNINESDMMDGIVEVESTKYSVILPVTRTIYTLNYSVNFFLYCLTGGYYRGALVALFTGSKETNQLSFRTPSTNSCTRESRL